MGVAPHNKCKSLRTMSSISLDAQFCNIFVKGKSKLNYRIVAKGSVFQLRKNGLSITKENPQPRPGFFQPFDRQSRMHPRVATMPLDNALEVSAAVMPSNQHYLTDMKQTVWYPRLFLGLLGVWPMLSRDSSPAKKYIFALLIVVFVILLSFLIIPPMLHIILIEKDMRLRFIMFGPTSYHLTNFLKYGFFLLRLKTIRPCVEHVETDWKSIVSERDRAIMRSNAKIGRRLTLISCIFTWSTGISIHTIIPIVSGKTINEMNETVRTLAYPGFDIFFDSQLQPTYEIIFFTICASAFVSYNVTSASCSFTAVFVCHACGLLQIVTTRFEALLNNIEHKKSDDLVKKRQSLIAQYHNRVLRLSSRIEEVVREICFMEVVSSTMIICFVEYCLINEWGNNDAARIATYCVALIANSFNILMFCYIGELLKEQGLRVGEAAYMIEWYKLPCKSSQDLIMIIIMSNNYPPKITAGRIFELSIRSFGSILKMSLTYCNVLRTVTV